MTEEWEIISQSDYKCCNGGEPLAALNLLHEVLQWC